MFDVVIIGAGVIGTSIARELSKYKLDIAVVEKEIDVAMGTTKANSAIVHAGFDAHPETLKGKLNARGNAMYDKLSKELNFPFVRNGSMVICFDEKDRSKLEELMAQGIENGVPDMKIIDGNEARAMEPNLSENVKYVLYVPTGGIVCPYEMTIALAENAYENGVKFFMSTMVTDINKKDDVYIIKTNKGDFTAKIVINAAGIHGDVINNLVSNHKMKILPRKGEYCLFDKTAGNIVKNTIFQLPTRLGKGILVTPTVDGNLLIGPNAEDIEDKEDLTTTKSGLEEILSKAELSIGTVPMGSIITSFAGLRARLETEDFVIEERADAAGFINVVGIQSPGLSSAPAIAEKVCGLVLELQPSELKDSFNPTREEIPKFRDLTNEQRKALIAKDSTYGRIVCRCENVTEGEILSAIRRPLGAVTLDGVKRRTRAGMGRCQSGFCSTKIVDILSKELKKEKIEITKFGGTSNIIIGNNKEI